MFGLDFVPKS